MDEYDKKFAEMQKYIPFLEAMIERLQNVKDKSREVQLQKMQSLHGILSNSKRKLKIETLQRCEDVLQKLHNKVEKGNTPGLHFPHKKNESSSAQCSNILEDVKPHTEDVMEDREIHETPASPTPPVSPDSGSQVAPIIIPTERSLDFDEKSDSKPASPDPIETLPTKAPIIIPTERTSNDVPPSSQCLCKNEDNMSFAEWDMLEENENHISRNKNWQTIITSSHDGVTVSKMVESNLSPKVNDGRSHMPISIHPSRQIQTVPVPSLGGSRRLSSILEKNRMMGINTDQVSLESSPESPVNMPDAQLKSPDLEILFPKLCKNTPLRSKEISRPGSKPSAPLLLSPPPVSTGPPLSMEDLAELLNEEDDSKMEKKGDRLREDSGKFKKDKQELGGNVKDPKTSKSFLLTQEDIDSESERRWEEIDKHIVKLTSRKCLPSGSKVDPLKSGETKGSPQGSLGHASSSFMATMSVDNRNVPSSPSSKTEPRFADNYERHPRQLRDNQGHDMDKSNVHNMHCRPDDDMSNQIHHGGSVKPDDRNTVLYQRRQGNIGPEMVPPRIDTEFRIEGPEYFNRQVTNQGHWPSMHPPVNTNDYCNNQWPSSSNFSGMPSSPAQTYPHPIGMPHQEMWNVGANRETIHMDPHQMNEGQIRPNQFPPNMNVGIRPLMSPNTRSQDMNHIPRSDDISNMDVPNVPTIQPLISPTRFPVGSQYRNFQGENRSYEPPFDRGMEYPHQRQPWDSPINRPNDVPYRPENEVPCGVMGPTEGPSGPYPRPSTPCPWNRDRDRNGRGRNTYYNERNRGESRNNFNRDTRRPGPRDNHGERDNCNRFGRDARNISDRDPRVRMEHNVNNQGSNQSRDNGTSVRDPRLAKDKHFPSHKGKDSSFNERDPRKRSTGPPTATSTFRKIKEKPKSPPKPVDSHKRVDTENSTKHTQEKTTKDKMQSPLESLYGVIDTKAKSAQGYCLQNFKIPKIKRNESSESPTSSHISEEIKECPLEKQDKASKAVKKDKEDATAEVSSSSDKNVPLENWNESNIVTDKKEELKEDNSFRETPVEENSDVNISELNFISTTSSKLPDNIEKSKKEEIEGSKSKGEMTQEWIEALIRKSFEFGEGKKFVEHAKFMQKLGEVLQAKKLKKIKRIIESESESSSSDKDDTPETKKVQTRKKRRVIFSDSSDDESLAERLGILKTANNELITGTSMDNQEEKTNTNIVKVTPNIESSDLSKNGPDPENATTKEEIARVETQNVAEEKKESNEDEININKEKSVPETPKEITKDELAEDKEVVSKIPKAKAKRRNSLEMLQEDIREMFISDDVVAATGYRLCRAQKENQNNAGTSTSNQSTTSIKKDESNKRDLDVDSDVEDTVVSSKQKKSTKSRVSDESSKSRGKSKKEVQRITRQHSKQYNQSSDSEEDQPLALRTELIQNSSSLSNQETSNEDFEVLRRSKRINKESIKEPRVVVEKTNISKLECSKVMFDSSSDESFGIDVSELAAAVDISIHPDKQSESEAVEQTEKKKDVQTSSRKSTRKKGNELLNESKDDVQFTDEESITSDISMSSSVTSSKKTGVISTTMDTSGNEKLLSNILVGLVPVKNDADKDSSIADKGSDADVDDDVSDQLPAESSTKKSSAKKKKKKYNWQMGILYKKRRKKTLTASSSKGDCELNASSEIDISNKGDTISENTTSKNSSSPNNTKQNISKKLKNDVKDTNSSEILQDNSKDKKEEVSIITSDPTEKKKSSLSKVCSNEQLLEKDNEQTNRNAEKNVVKNKIDLDRSFSELDVKKLIDYAWTGQEKYNCLLCLFIGKNIVHHYKLNHPGKEILISRLKQSDALLAIQNANDNNVESPSMEPLAEKICKFRCRFCFLFSEGAAKIAMEAFYEHCTTHTGEYRFRCNSCPYQTVAKSSMRTHYYKVCRKFKDTFVEAITEDEIPAENRIYGYLCSCCNFVQLKKSNVEEHVNLWHKDDLSVKIVKINMSLDAVEEEFDEQVDVPEKKIKLEVTQSNSKKGSVNEVVKLIEQNDDDITEIEVIKKDKMSDDEDKKIKDVPEVKHQEEDHSEPQVTTDDENKKPPQMDMDSNLPSGNLNVFVCPPELEKKEVEIQLERKKKMQEIIQNIGIKLQRDASKKGLSIIDKLKDKMKTDLTAANNETDSNVVSNSSDKSPINITTSPTPSMPPQSNTTELPCNSEIPSLVDSEKNLSLAEGTSNDKQLEDSTSQNQSFSTKCNSKSTSETNLTNSMTKVPLAILDTKKNEESDAETSDNENMRHSAPIYDSDSSSEQSDSELPTDVNMILKETSSMNASCKDPMFTTIQRLAAQLQATKQDETSSKPEDSKRSFPFGSIPKPPDVVPISSIKKFFGKKESKFHEISHDSHDDSNPPKNLIRLRRLSGDMLSVPMQFLDAQEDLSLIKNDASQSSTSDTMDSMLKSDVEEECSFLKIENVVSLAPRADGAESPIINDIRKAVEIVPKDTPIKSKGVSLLKKSNSPLILKRFNAVSITQTLTRNIQTVQSTPEKVKLIPVKSLSPSPVVTTTQLTTNFIPIAPKSTIIQIDSKLPLVTPSQSSQNLNYKIVKLVRTPALIKSKEPLATVSAVKLKSADAYKAMLKATKLIHLYKCMARDCRFSSDVLSIYHQHYLQHVNQTENTTKPPPFDYQKCAYCYMILEDWNQMKTHIDEKHAHCRYQCMYCFYRAIVPSYVQIHQIMIHPRNRGLLLGNPVKEIPSKEEVNRHDTIYPYVCQHDCGKFFFVPESFIAHLKNKHGTLLSGYKCHVCRTTCMKIDQLMTHYRTHGFYKFQCLYCLNGSDHLSELHNHLSTFHCNRLPQVLERTLPLQPIRNKDVIEQLIIRTLDDTLKITEEVIDLENEGEHNKETDTDIVNTSSSHAIVFPQLSNDVNLLNKDENEALNKSFSRLFGNANNSNSSLNAKTSQHEKSLNESSNDSAVSKIFESCLMNDSDVLATQVSDGESADKSLLDKSKKTNILTDKSSVEPTEASKGTFDCSDEFININLLDNPDFLKKVNHSINITRMNTSSATECKMEDSDIEIVDIDDTEVSPIKNIKSESNKKDSIDVSEIQNINLEKDVKEQSSSDVRDSIASCDAKEDSTMKTDKPLTLDDIKDTGFSGTQLYKCGYETCDYSSQTALQLKTHVKECSLRGENKNLTCAHCSKRFLKIGFLLEHLKSHGLKRFGCSLCKMRCTVGYQAMAHMKMKHKCAYSKLVPADPKNPSVDGLFIVQPIRYNGDRKGKKRRSNTKSSEKGTEKATTDTEKFSFSPDEIDSLPLQAIYNRVVQCAVCPYTTKVRTNIIRHLRLHAKDESVPESGPVNPVPCLDKKERMFDKMVNLASSSHQNGRMGGKSKETNKNNEDEFIPKFVPEHKRYVCGVAECNYLTVDEAMLRCHLKALHSEEQYFRCPHCPQPSPGQEGLNIAIDKMAVHLKMHDTRLYKCSHCNHHHYHRHVVERHLSDKHPEKRPFVKVIRELENTESSQQSIQEEVKEEVPDPDGNHWKCNFCDYKCVYKAEMANHTSVTHDEKSQYKCNSCSFKTNGKIMLEQHINSKHPNDLNVDYILMYQRIKGVNKKSTDNVEQTGQEEPFDTTPLWRRDMPRIRHIRGILLEEEDEMSTESSLKLGKRKSDTDLVTKPAKIKPGKSNSLDDTKQTKEKSKRSLSCDKVSTEVEPATSTSNTTEKAKETRSKSIEDNDLSEPDIGRFGPYGKADGNMYVCTLCTQFKTKYKHDMRDHLYRELNYARWHCKECGYLSVNRNALLKHFNKHHNGERHNHEPLSPDDDIEEWVGTLLKRQTLMMKGLLAKEHASDAECSATTSIAGNNSKPSSAKTTQNTVTKIPKTGNTVSKPDNKQGNKEQTPENTIKVQAEDNKDDAAPITNVRTESGSPKKKPGKITDIEKGKPDEEEEKPFTCKHCNMTFFRRRGFKLHVQLTHLKRLGFICPYCDRSTNSESLMRQHIRSKHPGCPEKIVENPAAGGPELPEEFWRQEYGIVFPKRKRKRKTQMSGGEVTEKADDFNIEPQEKCNLCNFTAMNTTGLKIHMRIHMTKHILKCFYCSFTAATKSEIWEHWEVNHPFSPFKVEDISPSESSSESTEMELDNKTITEDYSNDIEEEQISDAREDDSIYYCHYCSFRSKYLSTVQNHWNIMHNESTSQTDALKTKSKPFKYNEIRVSAKSLAKAQCSKTQAGSPYELYLQQSHSDVQEVESSGSKQEGWICQWCNELCDSEDKMKTHHTMFHSHLPLNFRKQEKTEMSRGYVCPDCPFTTMFLNVMKNHVSKHINLFKCKYCDKSFSCPSEVSTHNSEEHPGMELKIESIPNYESLLEEMMIQVKWQKFEPISDKNENSNPSRSELPRKNNAVAKKSTTKSAFRHNAIPCRIKAVARKSTNPHSRYLISNRIQDKQQEAKSKQFSYYGAPRSPVNLAKLNTYMVVGGHRMKVNCTTLAQLININPEIILEDVKSDIKNIPALKKLK
ncbi:uncharacterized protein LOC126873772 isoform X2 [Bombus huntii]|uniref:uncharacterized protein LOC126873772 isoform X2 n=1 Tax=Bombus huntii TaxID=85661 RepID=UPI0021AAAA72|nr:uncharacterized protein LOC126873772 isoform X2 [Bombus huntii]